MESKEIKISEKTYILNELKYKQLKDIDKDGAEHRARNMLMLSANITVEEFDDLSMKDGLTLQTAINEINGFGDFQKPQEK